MDKILEVKNMDVGYSGKTILKDISFHIKKGEIAVIAGKSGSGKSTILKTLIGLIPPVKGDVRFFGDTVDYFSERSFCPIYKRIGVLYQNNALINSFNVYDNIALPVKMEFPGISREIEEEMVYSRLAQVGLYGVEKLFPSEISGGMKKRAALARAMILNPEIIFCDEPSAGLDPITAGSIDDLIVSLKNLFNITFLVVTHELRSIRAIAGRILVLKEGKLHYFGNYKDMMDKQDLFISKFFSGGKKE
ncbi:MAG: ATP-binding cassette domain-containing protein [Acidobacteriota bacterium]